MREAVEPTKRATFTPKEKVAILAKSEGHCAYPMCAVTAGLEIDHTIPIWLGGKHCPTNATALCGSHHKQKTAQDAAIRAHIKRLHKREAGEKKPTTIRSRGFAPGKRTIPSRPFPKRTK